MAGAVLQQYALAVGHSFMGLNDLNVLQSSSSTEGAPVLLESPLSKPSTRQSSARSSKEDLRWSADARPWSSTDSSGYSTDSSTKLKVNMTKASSCGGTLSMLLFFSNPPRAF